MNKVNLTATCGRGSYVVDVPRPVDVAAVWRTARTLVQQQGGDAPAVAARHARELLAAGEIERRLTWMRVMAASKALLGNETAQADGRHEIG